MRPSVHVVSVVVLMLFAGLPATAGTPDEGGANPVALYLQPWGTAGVRSTSPGAVAPVGLDVFPGNATRGDPSTIGSRVVRSTAPLPYDVVLDAHDAFRVVLPGGVAYEPVDAWYSVSLVSATGARIVLGQASVSGSEAGLMTSDPSTPAVPESLRSAVEDSLGSGPAGAGVSFVHAECARTGYPHCRQLYGDYGYGGLGYCRQPFATLTGPADGAVHALTSRRVCQSASDDVNATARALDEGVAGHAPPPAEEPSAANDWRDVTFDAAPPASLVVGGGKFLVPAGTRLELLVELGAEDRLLAPGLFEFGHSDARARVVLRAHSAGAFAAFTAAELVGAGPHSGRFSGPPEAHAYAIDVDAGTTLQVSDATGARFALFTSDGAPVPTLTAFATSAERFILRIESANAVPTQRYSFVLALSAPEGDGGIVAEGTHAGSLGPGDGQDTFVIDAWEEQHIRLRVDFPAGSSFRIQPAGGSTLWSEAGMSYHEILLQHGWTGAHKFDIIREWGAASYTLTVDLDEGGDLSLFPRLEPLVAVDAVSDLVPVDGAVEFLTVNGSVGRFDGSAVVSLGSLPEAIGQHFARLSGDARIYTRAVDGRPVTLQEGSDLRPIATGFHRTIMGADGALYGIQGDSQRLRRVDAELHVSDVGPASDFPTLLAAPNGVIYGVGGGSTRGTVSVLHVPPGAVALPAEALTGLTAFDTNGNAYLVRNASFVDRLDAVTLARTLVAWGSGIRDVALAGNTFYARLHVEGPLGGLAAMPVDVMGFEGFRLPFDPAPTPDLQALAVVDERIATTASLLGPAVYETHRVVVTIRNGGAGDSPTTTLRISRESPAAYASFEFAVPPIPAGETTNVEFEWIADDEVGDYGWWARVDARDLLAERDEDDNVASGKGTAFAGGGRTACLAAMTTGVWVPGCSDRWV